MMRKAFLTIAVAGLALLSAGCQPQLRQSPAAVIAGVGQRAPAVRRSPVDRVAGSQAAVARRRKAGRAARRQRPT